MQYVYAFEIWLLKEFCELVAHGGDVAEHCGGGSLTMVATIKHERNCRLQW